MFGDKAVVVTGDPRSGTSLMMQTLKALGVDVAGYEWPHLVGKSIPEERVAKSKELNPKGFYEIPGVVVRGFQELDLKILGHDIGLRNKAVKVVSCGVCPSRNFTRSGVPEELVHKYILCLRDPRWVSQSQTKLSSSMRIQILGIDRSWRDLDKPADPFRFAVENGNLCTWLVNTNQDLGRWLVVDYDEYMSDPKATINEICNFLELNPSSEEYEAALNNIDLSLKRSDKEFEGWPKSFETTGEVADHVYKGLKEFSTVGLATGAIKFQSWIVSVELERVKWYDKTTGLMMGPELYRQIKESDTLKHRLIETFVGELKRGRQFVANPDFIETRATYTVKRPPDIGPLTRNKVQYSGVEMTLEEAQALHMQLLGQNKAKRDPKLVEAVLSQMTGEIE